MNFDQAAAATGAVGAMAAVLSLWNLIARASFRNQTRLLRFAAPIDWVLAVVGLGVTAYGLISLFNGNVASGSAVLLVAVLIGTAGFAIFIVLAAFWPAGEASSNEHPAQGEAETP